MKRRVFVVVVGILLIAGISSVVWIRSSKDASTSVGAKEAAQIASDGQPTKSDEDSIVPGLRPRPGTYQYIGSGKESLSLLGGSQHVFPKEVFAVVKLDPDDKCSWTMNLIFIEEHTEKRNFCTTKLGVTDTGFSRTTEFSRYEQTSKYTCDDQALRLKSGSPKSTRWTWTCTEKRGGVVRFTATNIGEEQLSIGGTQAPVTHIRITATQRGRSNGTETSDWWLMPSGLPAKMQSTRSLITSAGPLGKLNSAEQFSYTLADLNPESA